MTDQPIHIPVPAALALAMAGVMSKIVMPRCPKCGGKLVTHVTVYPNVSVDAEVFGDGMARVRYTSKMQETKKELVEEIAHNYGGARLDERDEIFCENYRMGDEGCDYWTHPDDLEHELGERVRKRLEQLQREAE